MNKIRIMLQIGLILVVIGMCSACGTTNSTYNTDTVKLTDAVKENTPGQTEVAIKPTQAQAPETKELSSGNYIAGKDFTPGTYDIVALEGNGNVSSDNMYSGGINAVMGVGDSTMYEKEYKNIKLPKGTTLTISRVKIKLTKVN